MEIWGNSEIQKQFEGSTRNKKIFEIISQRLVEYDILRTADQCRKKVKKLCAEYKQIRNHNNVSDRNHKTIRFLPQLDAVLGHRPSTEPSSVIESSIDNSVQVEDGSSSNNSVVENDESEGVLTAVHVLLYFYFLCCLYNYRGPE